MSEKQHANIRRWGLTPLGGGWHLIGEVVNHPNQRSFHAKRQITSPLVRIDFEAKTAETRNTHYTLLDD